MNKQNPELKDEVLGEVVGGIAVPDQIPGGLKLKCKSCDSTNVAKNGDVYICANCGKSAKIGDSSAFLF